MKRLVLAACLSAPGFAFGQAGGVITIGGQVTSVPVDTGTSITLTAGGINVGDLHLTLTEPGFGDFQPIFSDPGIRAFPLHFEFSGTAAQAGNLRDAPIPIYPAALGGMPVIITVEEEGVRMPDEQFTLPPE